MLATGQRTPLTRKGPVTSSSPEGSWRRKTTRRPLKRPASRMSTVPGTMLARRALHEVPLHRRLHVICRVEARRLQQQEVGFVRVPVRAACSALIRCEVPDYYAVRQAPSQRETPCAASSSS